MEAYEERDVKRDSFEEVDRILAIVEESKKKVDKEKIAYNLFFGLLTGTLISTVTFTYNTNAFNKETGLILSLTGVLYILLTVFFYTKAKQVRREFEHIKYLALEVIREVVPTLSRSEHWSSLRKFELRLRLSKLGINTDKTFGREFDLP